MLRTGTAMIPPLAKNPRYHSLDLWRGLICLWVVLEHSAVALWPGSNDVPGPAGVVMRSVLGFLELYLGTPLFFVISGYCIAASVDSTRRKGHPALAFLGRRIWRIFPPYWAALLFFLAVVVGLDAAGLGRLHKSSYGLELWSPGILRPGQWLGNLTLTETWRPILFGGERTILTRVAWSLCYQEQFYLVCFLALVFAPRRLYGVLGLATLGIVAFRVATWDAGAAFRFEGLFPMLWHEFAVGLAVYWRLNVARTWQERRAIDAALAGLLVVGCLHGPNSTIASALFGLLLIGLRPFDDRAASWSHVEPLRTCGRRSFSVYLVHLPVCTVVNAVLVELGLASMAARTFLVVPISSGLAIAAGFAFHRLVDSRFQTTPDLAPARAAVGQVVAFLNRPIRLRPALATVGDGRLPRG